jgi:cell division protein FtsB
VLRTVAEELATWRERALRAETGRGGASGRPDADMRARLAELEADNRALRQRVDTARERVSGLLGRLTFLEEQAREQSGNGGAGR